ncbi:MAG: T9SS type A sorting domain-containing protein, partial [Bacteroidia bacterium]|nr:T9SS type A sorting domain-containing protein [Bacteroidia bacterium]
SSPVCEGSSINLTSGGGNAYSWSGPNGFNSTVQNPVLSNATLANTGNYTVTVTGANGCTQTSTTPVVVNALPSATSGNSSPVCEGSSVNLTSGGGNSYSWSGPNGFTSLVQNPVLTNVTPVNAGVYTVVVTNGNGCSKSSTTNVSVNAAPVANAGPDVSVSVGGSVQLAASGGSAYSWTPATGLSNTFIPNPVATPSVTTVYTVWVTNSSDCTGSDSVTVFVWQTPVADPALSIPVKIFPNPAHDEIIVEGEGLENGTYYLTMYNGLGQLVIAKTLSVTDGKIMEKIEVLSFSEGVYYLQLDGDKGFFQQKVIKE